MAFTYGFYNSMNGDRKYNATQMAAIFDGLIGDGVFSTIGELFAVTPGDGIQVTVGTGRAWFDHTWNYNDTKYPINLEDSHLLLTRIDAIILEINPDPNVRANKLTVIPGEPSMDPVKPRVTNGEFTRRYPLAYVTIRPKATSINLSDIENCVGTAACPFVTGILDTVNIDVLFSKWDGEFHEWFTGVRDDLSGDVVSNILNRIDKLDQKVESYWHLTLSDTTRDLMGLDKNASPDDAFITLYLGPGQKIYRIRVLDYKGNPCVGYSVSGLTKIPNLSASATVTDAYGEVFGSSASDPARISVTSPYYDILSASNVSVPHGSSVITAYTINLSQRTPNYVTVTSSNNYTFSSNVREIGYELVAGGGGGSFGWPYQGCYLYTATFGGSYPRVECGTGGGGGQLVKFTRVSYTSPQVVSISIGAKGSGGRNGTEYYKEGTVIPYATEAGFDTPATTTRVLARNQSLIEATSGGNTTITIGGSTKATANGGSPGTYGTINGTIGYPSTGGVFSTTNIVYPTGGSGYGNGGGPNSNGVAPSTTGTYITNAGGGGPGGKYSPASLTESQISSMTVLQAYNQMSTAVDKTVGGGSNNGTGGLVIYLRYPIGVSSVQNSAGGVSSTEFPFYSDGHDNNRYTRFPRAYMPLKAVAPTAPTNPGGGGAGGAPGINSVEYETYAQGNGTREYLIVSANINSSLTVNTINGTDGVAGRAYLVWYN